MAAARLPPETPLIANNRALKLGMQSSNRARTVAAQYAARSPPPEADTNTMGWAFDSLQSCDDWLFNQSLTAAGNGNVQATEPCPSVFPQVRGPVLESQRISWEN